jgi:hypothetical protein
MNTRQRQDGMREVGETLKAGVAILDELMCSHGFAFTPASSGVGSGGAFASGEFRRGRRRLELHIRYSLGLVTYHVGDLALSHEDYMWSVLGRRWASQYPGFSKEPLDGFRHLLSDLRMFGSDFLVGSDDDFAKHVQRAEALKKPAPHLPS